MSRVSDILEDPKAASTASSIPMNALEPSTSSIDNPSTQLNGSQAPEAEARAPGFIRDPVINLNDGLRRDKTVKRELRGIHLFMITINGTLGTGLYWRGGQILELGGPLAVLLSFLIVGLLSWAVMQCITEMLCIWPIPGALSVYVSEFVDYELGIVVGISYWFTYSVSFASIIAVTAGEVHYWGGENKGIDGAIIFLLIPLILVLINAFGIKIYGMIEVFTGTVKLLFLTVIIVTLIVIVGSNSQRSKEYWDNPAPFDKKAAQNWFAAFLMSLSISAFAYVGVEIVAASALEARWPGHQDRERTQSNISQRSNQASLIGRTVKFSAVFISILATIAYTLSGVLVSSGIGWQDCALPRLSWVDEDPNIKLNCKSQSSISAFVAIAEYYKPDNLTLANVFNVFLVFTALSCANTNLYVASRSLFGLASRLDGGPGQHPLLRTIAWFGQTNHRKVPMRAMVFSAIAFCWVPFLQLIGTRPVDTFIEVLSQMGSVGVLIVWACECWAFIRYYNCIDTHRSILERKGVSQVRRWDPDPNKWNDYPYRSHGQPFTAYVALVGCCLILVVANGAALWKGFETEPFLSAYLIVILFFVLWILLKRVRRGRWSFLDLVNLSEEQIVINKIETLHDIRLAATANVPE